MDNGTTQCITPHEYSNDEDLDAGIIFVYKRGKMAFFPSLQQYVFAVLLTYSLNGQ
jgi:hypothetical protein